MPGSQKDGQVGSGDASQREDGDVQRKGCASQRADCQRGGDDFQHADSAPRLTASASHGVHRGPRSISSFIVKRLCWAFVILVLVLAAAIALLIYRSLDHSATSTLEAESHRLATEIASEIASADAGSSEGQSFAEEAARFLESSVVLSSPETRVTMIDSDGSVIYDSVADASILGNHSDRPEIAEALESGESTQGRYSDTLGEETIYHAIRLDDGVVLRLSMTQASIWGVMQAAFAPALLVIVMVVAAAWIVVRRTTLRISKHLGNLDLDHPMANDRVPEEITPLLERLEDQRRRLAAQESERRRFTSSASHELKTPLTVISGYAEIISNGIARPEDVQGFAELIHRESTQMKEIVDDLLVLARLDEASEGGSALDMTEEVSLGEAAASTAEHLLPAAERAGIRLELDVPDGVDRPQVMVVGNRRMLHELIRNLVENAIRHNVAGGVARVVVESDLAGRPVLRVSDTGVGVPPEYREKIFERFFCVEESRSKETGGSGLGLAIVKHAAMLHGAQVLVRDNVPAGSIFEVVFPRW